MQLKDTKIDWTTDFLLNKHSVATFHHPFEEVRKTPCILKADVPQQTPAVFPSTLSDPAPHLGSMFHTKDNITEEIFLSLRTHVHTQIYFTRFSTSVT